MPGRDRHHSQRARRPSGRGPHGHVQHEPRIVSAGWGTAARGWAGASGPQRDGRGERGLPAGGLPAAPGDGARPRGRRAAAERHGGRCSGTERRGCSAIAAGPRRAAGERRFVKADPGRRLDSRRSALRLAASHVCVTWLLQNTSSFCGFCNAGAR